MVLAVALLPGGIQAAGGARGSKNFAAGTLLYIMEASNWTAPSGIDIRELVWSLLVLAENYEAASEDDAAAVTMLIIDGEKFLEATEEE
jgi:hypothetical protein